MPRRLRRLAAPGPSARRRVARRLVPALAVVALVAAACGAGSTPSTETFAPPSTAASGAASGTASPGPTAGRPSSPAVVAIVSPASGTSFSGVTSVHVVLTLANATIVQVTTTNIRPDQGHVHLYVDNILVSMNYGLQQDLPVHPGTYVLKAEFVAADHAPFDPRVWSAPVVFTVR